MSVEKVKQSIGFVTVCEEEGGAFGGYLLVNLAGRPLEFHCTTPVKPNRAQEILYGESLVPYLYGELIGAALVKKSKLQPAWILTDQTPVLSIRESVDVLVGCLVESAVDELTVSDPIQLGGTQVVTSARYRKDLPKIEAIWREHTREFDLWEPFERIRSAIQEAQRNRSNRAA
jgi:hypothetical protein